METILYDLEFWPEGWYHDDEEISSDGVIGADSVNLENVPDEVVVKISGGLVFRVGEYFFQNGPSSPSAEEFEGHFRKWQKKQNTIIFSVEVPREKAQEERLWSPESILLWQKNQKLSPYC